jgi:putative FmdB family regulatory protein
MPIYEYHCKQCGVFEVTQRITENALSICPTCGGDIHRLISLTSFVLKGSGWYATDYARSNDKSESSSDATSSDSTPKEGAANGSSEKSASGSAESSKTTPAESTKSSPEKSPSAKTAA